VSRKIGKFEMADGGTILLDEIGDMPLSTQAKLLRVLQEREFERVGGTQTIEVDVRFIAASNKNLFELVKRGEFREDLYYRINVFTIIIPPLRERKDDISSLVEYFLKEAPRETRISPGTPKAMENLMRYEWPGNVRELRNIVERAVLMSEDGIIEPADIINMDMQVKDHDGDKSREPELLHEAGEGSVDHKLKKLEKSLSLLRCSKPEAYRQGRRRCLESRKEACGTGSKKYDLDPASFK